jgi:lactoylglutathione lyase
MRFCWSTLRVKNLDESIKFYTEIVGLDVLSRFQAGPGSEIAFLGSGDTQIELHCDGLSRQSVIGDDISWGFVVDSLEKALALVNEKGISVDSGIIQPNPHIRFFFVRDPNGMRIQFVENIA